MSQDRRGDRRSEPKDYSRIPRSSFASSECGKEKLAVQFRCFEAKPETTSKKTSRFHAFPRKLGLCVPFSYIEFASRCVQTHKINQIVAQ